MEVTKPEHRTAATGGWAYYRLPEEEVYTHVSCQRVKTIKGGHEAVGRERGVVITPFEPTADEPCLLITPDSLQTLPVPDADDESLDLCVDFTLGHDDYARGFNLCHQALTSGSADEVVKKVVMCRRVNLTFTQTPQAKALFLRACRRLPHSYVSLWYTPQSGMWLVATPEFLLVADSEVPRRYYTMALAGTLAYEGRLTPPAEWTDKNRAEQRLVSATIFEQLTDVAVKVDQSPVHTVKAAHLQHLRTDFAFEVPRGVKMGQLISLLHPTPAICGLPATAAAAVIKQAEGHSRHYYAGYSGPIGLTGQTALFVTLRCMQIDGHNATLYAGGGLMADSDLEDEWQETCRKMESILLMVK